jgi:hypothetical protein
MSEELPALPKPEVQRAVWDDGAGWGQYHDERDPLPTKWDDDPPDEVRGFYSGDQMRAYARLAIQQERERCAKMVDAMGDFGDGMSDLAAAIRKGETP